jgi:hypothetical protein
MNGNIWNAIISVGQLSVPADSQAMQTLAADRFISTLNPHNYTRYSERSHLPDFTARLIALSA